MTTHGCLRSSAAMILLVALAALSPSYTHAAAEPETLRGHLMPFKCQHDDKATHTRDCALRAECLITGYGIAMADGTFVQFDSDGNKKAIRLLRSSKKASDLRAVAEGSRVGTLFRLKSLRLE
jgi:hypothetical protein